MIDELKTVIYLHAKAIAHAIASADVEIALLMFQRLSYPPYSLDLALLDFV